jgi:peptidoglycan/xylan/chitin deacetylase (PgdA/CDA1 family)
MNNRPTFITTSWDDGHILDLRVAQMLDKYGLTGTFYVPQHAEYGTMNTSQIRQLSQHYEIGAHTIDHLALTDLPEDQARQQIVNSKAWVEQITGRACPMFCPPKGRFTKSHLAMVHDAGFPQCARLKCFRWIPQGVSITC